MRTVFAGAGILVILTGLRFALAQERPGARAGGSAENRRGAADASQNPRGQNPSTTKGTAPSESRAPRSDVDQAGDRREVQKLVQKFQRAYNAHDPRGIRDCFLPKGQWVDESASSLRGDDAIEKACTALFEREPQSRLEAEVEGIWFPGDHLALVQVHATIASAPGQRDIHDRISMVSQQTSAGDWAIAVLYDQAGEEGDHHARLEPLDWILGDWIDESPREAARVNFAWSPGGNSLVGRFHLQMGDQLRGAGEERIGWDPIRKRIRSWIFDADGGYLEGEWYRSGERWIVKYSGATAAGAARSSTHELTPIDADHWKWSARDRVIGDVLEPDITDVTVVRRAPPPDLSDE